MSKITTAMKVGSVAQFSLYLIILLVAFVIYDTYQKAKANLQ